MGMRVLVCVQVRGADTGGQDTAYLGVELFFDIEIAGGDGGDQAGDGARESFAGPAQSALADQDEVYADTERRIVAGKQHGMVKLASICHDGCRGDDAFAMRGDDSFVDVAGEAKVVRVDDELPDYVPSLRHQRFIIELWDASPKSRPWCFVFLRSL
jgi:hypothetical protein